MALRILVRSVSETISGLVRVRDTVMVPTPARCATSVRVTALRGARVFLALDGTWELVIGDMECARGSDQKAKSFGFLGEKIALSSLLSSSFIPESFSYPKKPCSKTFLI